MRGSAPTFRDVLRIRVFAVLYAAETQSILGDQLARVALSVLVFDWTHSPAATGATYAFTFLPAILGGLVLARVGDRVPRRAVMVACDVLRAALFVSMAIPGIALGVVFALVSVAVFIGPAFTAAQVSYQASTLSPEHFRVGTGLRMMTNQAAQVVGFALGGVAVAVLDPHGALILDAITYLASAIAIGVWLRGATPGREGGGAAVSVAGTEERDDRNRGRLWRNPRVRSLLALAALAGFFVVPEGLAIPFGDESGASTVQIGLLLAAIPLGGALGVALVVPRIPSRRRLAVAGWMAVGCGVPLVAAAAAPSWPFALTCWFASGVLSAFQVEVFTASVQAVPDRQRAQLVGAGTSLLLGSQGLGVLAFGFVASVVPPSAAIGLAGLVGSGLALALVLGPFARVRRRPQPGPNRPSRRPQPVS